MSRKYQGFALDIPLIEHIKKVIDGHWRYKTVTDFVRQAILEKLDREFPKLRR